MRIIVHKTEDNWVEEQFPAFTDDHPPSNKGEGSLLSMRTNNKQNYQKLDSHLPTKLQMNKPKTMRETNKL